MYAITFACPSKGFGFKVRDDHGAVPFVFEVAPGSAVARTGKVRNGHEIVSVGCDGEPQKDTTKFSKHEILVELRNAKRSAKRCKIEFKDPLGEIEGHTTIGGGGMAALQHVAAYYGRFQTRRKKINTGKKDLRNSYSFKIKKAAENAHVTKAAVEDDARKRHQRVQERVIEMREKRKAKEGDGTEVEAGVENDASAAAAGGKYVVQVTIPLSDNQ